MKTLCFIIALSLSSLAIHAAEPTAILYRTNFNNVEADKVPDDFLVLDGGFAVKSIDSKHVLELPGSPLDTFGVLFGPTTNAACVSAQIFGTGKGRRFPAFGVGLAGVNGYKLKVSPGKGMLEIYKGDDAVASAPFNWKSESWTMFRLRVRPAGDSWKVEGKAWLQGAVEPKEWMVTLEEKAAPAAGRASIWGSPYSGTPIRFDDLLVTGVTE